MIKKGSKVVITLENEFIYLIKQRNSKNCSLVRMRYMFILAFMVFSSLARLVEYLYPCSMRVGLEDQVGSSFTIIPALVDLLFAL